MSVSIEPGTRTTFTVTKLPTSESASKTLVRLMQMQPEVKKALGKLKLRREREDNRQQQRGGRMWTARAKASKLVHIEPGATFTLRVTPQIKPDLESVAQYLTAAPACGPDRCAALTPRRPDRCAALTPRLLKPWGLSRCPSGRPSSSSSRRGLPPRPRASAPAAPAPA